MGKVALEKFSQSDFLRCLLPTPFRAPLSPSGSCAIASTKWQLRVSRQLAALGSFWYDSLCQRLLKIEGDLRM